MYFGALSVTVENVLTIDLIDQTRWLDVLDDEVGEVEMEEAGGKRTLRRKRAYRLAKLSLTNSRKRSRSLVCLLDKINLTVGREAFFCYCLGVSLPPH